MKAIYKLAALLFFAITLYLPVTAYAEETCVVREEIVNTQDGFDFSFRIKSNGKYRFRLSHPNSTSWHYPIWTDESMEYWNNREFYDRNYVNDNLEHRFRITFDYKSMNYWEILGTAKYYVDGELKNLGYGKRNPIEINLKSKVFDIRTQRDFSKIKLQLVEKRESCNSISPVPNGDSRYEFGVKQCDSMPCTINFKNTYSSPPLVFIMPTIDPNTRHPRYTHRSPDYDAPSRLYLKNINARSAEMAQVGWGFAPRQYRYQEMKQISYFVIEPGVAVIDGHKVLAGYLSTKEYRGITKNSRGYGYANYAQFGINKFDSEPVILHQIQSNHNGSRWLTSGRHDNRANSNEQSKKQIQLFLELSASGSTPYAEDKIAFLATEPSSGVLDAGNYNLKFGRIQSALQWHYHTPMKDGCGPNLDEVFSSDKQKIAGIVLKKQERVRTRGVRPSDFFASKGWGWLRLCKVQANKVSVVTDVNMRIRGRYKSGLELVGYVAFSQKQPLQNIADGVCQYVPDGLQTNHYIAGPKPGGVASVSGRNNKIHPDRPDPQYSFHSITQRKDLCIYKQSLKICSIDASKTFPSLPQFTPFYYSGDDNLTVDRYDQITLRPLNKRDHNNITINKHSTLTLSGGEYWVNELKFLGTNSNLVVQAPSIIHYKKIVFQGPNVNINQSGDKDSKKLLFIGHGSNAEIKFANNSNNYKINAFFYVNPSSTNRASGFDLSGNNNIITGGVTAHSIGISGNNNKVYTQSCQPIPKPKVTSIDIKPNNYHLTCGANNKVEVHLKDSEGKFVNDITGLTLTLTESSVLKKLNISKPSIKNGVATFDVTPKNKASVGRHELMAKLTGDGLDLNDKDNIEYVPYKFEITKQKFIAGQNNKIDIKVKACNGNSQEITLGYVGTPSAAFTYQSPQAANAIKRNSDLSFSANLNNSNRKADINFKESGKITVTVKDENFVCNGQGCPAQGGVLKGQFEIESRPWKIAICNVTQTGNTAVQNPATTSSGNGFLTAGSGFSATYRPIVHSDSKGQVSDECAYPITGNYGLDNGPLNLNYRVVYPASGSHLGAITPSAIPRFASSRLTQTLGHTWSEVGTLEVKTDATYLGMTLNSDSQSIGRFYPSYFKVDETQWNNPLTGIGSDKQTFTYMNQPFSSVIAKVGAYNQQGAATNNYAAFDASLQAGFELVEHQNRLTHADRTSLSAKSSYQANQWVLNSDQITWGKKSDLTPDGPFNYPQIADSPTTIKLQLVPARDAAVFKLSTNASASNSQLLLSQPKVVFGRYNLMGVGGVENQPLTVPLQVEYWDGTQFKVNQQDDFSSFDGSHYCAKRIWPPQSAVANNVALSGTGKPSQGQSRDITAAQTASTREQVQLWLRLDAQSAANCYGSNNNRPWLMYDWDKSQLGEENPSAVVTFGIFRGNDKVIFRGESGLTGQ